MRELNYYQGLARELIAADRERDKMLAAMEDMWHSRWSLPENVQSLRWIHKVVSTDPHDALRAGARVLSAVQPRLRLQPLGTGPESRTQADAIERALGWHFQNASRRRRASVLRDIVLSALLYDEVVAQVVYLPHQIAALQAFNGDTRRLEAARRFGPFAVLVRNPRHVHVRYSDWMPEAVLMTRVVPLWEALDFWGDRAEGLRARLGTRNAAGLDHVTLYDYMDLDVRVVWGQLHQGIASQSEPDGAAGVELLREEHDLGFLPWIAKVGGSTLENDPAYQRNPLLYSVYQAGQWDTQNIIETLMTSEVIAYASAPRLKIEGPTDNIDVDYGEPGRPAYVPPGHDLNPLSPPGLDESLAAIADRIGARIGKSTVPRVLQTGDFPSSTPFATLNLATQAGVKALAPYKELAELALADIFTHMLYWVDYTGEPLVAYGQGRDDSGSVYTIRPGDFDVENLFLDVELTADVPTDRMARINAAALAVRELGYSRARALEQIGESDPQIILAQARAEDLEQTHFEVFKQRLLAEAERGQLEDLIDQRLQAALNGPSQESTISGQEFNPALGGSPPVMATPETPTNGKKQQPEAIET